MADTPFYGDGTSPGWKGNTSETRANSIAALRHVLKDLGDRHKQMLEAWTPYGTVGAIPEQIADDLDLPVHIVRPRCGELAKRGLLYPIGRRMGGLGQKVMAYSAVKPAGASLHA